MQTPESWLVAFGFGAALGKAAAINVNEPVGQNGTIVITAVPKLSTTGVPRGILGRSGDQTKTVRAIRIRLALALKGFENDPDTSRFSQVSGLLGQYASALGRLQSRIRGKSPDAAEDVGLSVREGRKGVKAARLWLRQGDFDKSLQNLKLARDHFDEAFETLQRVIPAVFRR